MNRVLIVAAHPDDEILGCGGLIAKRRASTEFKVLIIAEGTTCRYPAAQMKSETALADLQVRTRSARRAFESLGVKDVTFCDLPCGRLDREPIVDINKLIERALVEFEPDTVITHSGNDVNNDHGIVARSAAMATRPVGPAAPDLLAFETQSSTEWNLAMPFAPCYFEVLTEEQVAAKWNALACYETEIREYPHPRSRLGVETLARYRGMQVGAAYAEAFVVVRQTSR